MNDRIVFDHIQRSFGGKPVLRDLSFRVRDGEIFALLGRNGAGKTTALSILLGFLRPMGGTSSILGKPSEKLDGPTRMRIGLVTEGHVMYRWMSVKRALAFEAGTRSNFDRAHAESMVQRLGISQSKSIRTLSRGQQAQLCLVCAMAGDPEVLVLDDPAMGLDAVMRREFLDAMIDLLGREGRSVLFSSHILGDVERLADRVGILHGGRLIVDAPMDELKRRVQKRIARGVRDEAGIGELIGGVLRTARRRDGLELLLLDCDAERESKLRAACDHLSEAITPNLEELFVDLTTDANASNAAEFSRSSV